MTHSKKVAEILNYAILLGWSEKDLSDAQWKLREMPVVSEGIERRTKALRNSIIALVLALLTLGITLLRVWG